MTGTIRKHNSRPSFARVNHEKESKRRRRGVSIDCEDWQQRPSSGRRDFEYLRRNHHGHALRPHSRQQRATASARKRRDIRRERRSNKDVVEDNRSLDELMLEDEVSFVRWMFEKLKSKGVKCLY